MSDVPQFKATIGEREFTIVLSSKRILKLEAALGRPLIQVANEMARLGNLGFQDVVLILITLGKNVAPREQDDLATLLLTTGLAAALPMLTELFERILTGGVSPDKETKESNEEPDE